MKPVTYHLTEQQIDRLRAESKRTGLTVAEMIRRAIDAWLAEQDQPKNGKAKSNA